jgi:hypothetical protein
VNQLRPSSFNPFKQIAKAQAFFKTNKYLNRHQALNRKNSKAQAESAHDSQSSTKDIDKLTQAKVAAVINDEVKQGLKRQNFIAGASKNLRNATITALAGATIAVPALNSGVPQKIADTAMNVLQNPDKLNQEVLAQGDKNLAQNLKRKHQSNNKYALPLLTTVTREFNPKKGDGVATVSKRTHVLTPRFAKQILNEAIKLPVPDPEDPTKLINESDSKKSKNTNFDDKQQSKNSSNLNSISQLFSSTSASKLKTVLNSNTSNTLKNSLGSALQSFSPIAPANAQGLKMGLEKNTFEIKDAPIQDQRTELERLFEAPLDASVDKNVNTPITDKKIEILKSIINGDISSQKLADVNKKVIKFTSNTNQSDLIKTAAMLDKLNQKLTVNVNLKNAQGQLALYEETADDDAKELKIASLAEQAEQFITTDKYASGLDEFQISNVNDLQPNSRKMLEHLLGTLTAKLNSKNSKISEFNSLRYLEPDAANNLAKNEIVNIKGTDLKAHISKELVSKNETDSDLAFSETSQPETIYRLDILSPRSGINLNTNDENKFIARVEINVSNGPKGTSLENTPQVNSVTKINFPLIKQVKDPGHLFYTDKTDVYNFNGIEMNFNTGKINNII